MIGFIRRLFCKHPHGSQVWFGNDYEHGRALCLCAVCGRFHWGPKGFLRYLGETDDELRKRIKEEIGDK